MSDLLAATSDSGSQPLSGCTPLLPSQERLYKQRIKELEDEKKAIYASALRHCTRVINLSDISEEDKQYLLNEIWEDML